MKLSMFALAASATLSCGCAHAADARTGPLYEALGSPDGWRISGSFRARLEGVGGQFRPAPAPEGDRFLSFRTTILAEYDAGPVRIGGELFDSRGYLEEKDSTVGTSEINALELGQAYLGLDLGQGPGGGSNGTLTVGRFTMDAGSRRLIARNQFRNTINAFTGARLEWRDRAKDRLLLFWTMPHVRLPDAGGDLRNNEIEWDRESPDLQFFGASFTKAGVLGGSLEVYGYGLIENDSAALATRNRHLFTPGVRLARSPKPGAFDYEAEAIYQTGRERGSARPADLKDLDVSAYFVHLEVGRTFQAPWKPRVALQYDLASGDGPDPDTYNRFDTLFGARRGEYGPTSLWGAVQRANLNSPALRVEASPDERWDGFLALRPLWLQTTADSFASTGVKDATGRSGKFAGEQLEARVRYWIVPGQARFETGAAWLFKGRFLKDAPSAPRDGDSRYGYADVTFTF
jgi:hypothetical protein